MKFNAIRGESDEGGDFIRLKDGDSVRGVFRGDPFVFRQHWVGQSTIRCPDNDTCERCKAGEKPAFRFKLNFIVKENDQLAVKVLEQGWKLYQALNDLQAGGWDLEKNFVVIKRTGKGKNDTVYSANPVPNGTLGPEGLKSVEALTLTNFSEQPQREPGEDSDDIPTSW